MSLQSIETPCVQNTAISKGLYKKQNGVFYTTGEVLGILCDWAVRTPADIIMEPSFGGCGFLAALKKRLIGLGCSSPEDNLFGCDIDPRAFDTLRGILAGVDLTRRFIKTDFLRAQPADFDAQSFDVVIGNPPYVSHHLMSSTQKESAFALANKISLSNRKASLWAYLVCHSLSFIKPGGRCAWVLPGSLLYSEYGQEVRNRLKGHFRRSLFVQLGERLFLDEGTKEQTVIALGEGFGDFVATSDQVFGFAQTLRDLQGTIAGWDSGAWRGTDGDTRPCLALLEENRKAFEGLNASAECRSLGDFCRIRIGLVTGDNRFFVVNSAAARSAQLSADYLTFILSKFSDAPGMGLTSDDQAALWASGKRCMLVDTAGVDAIDGNLEAYLSAYSEDDRRSNATFRKRQQGSLWHRPNDGSVPDAFFPYMQKNGPAILLNPSTATCTNTVHRVYFSDSVDDSTRKLIAISIRSTFSQLSAEIEGRCYGSGVLKHEPSEVVRIRVIAPPDLQAGDIRATYDSLDQLLRKGNAIAAQNRADDFVMAHLPSKERANVQQALRDALSRTRARRQCHAACRSAE